MRLAYSYKRFSTPEQSKGNSAARQDAGFQRLCQAHDLVAATEYFDHGRSAWKGGKQRDLEKFLDLVKSGQVTPGSWLIIESLDRLSRQGFRKTQKLLEQIIESGCTVATTSPERVLTLTSLDDPMALIEILFIATRAKEESDRKSERVKSAWNAKLNRARDTGVKATKRGPAWLELVDGEWAVIPDRVKVVKQIFKWSLKNGLGQRAICKRLNKSGVTPFKTRNGSGNKWGWAYVRNILTDRKVLGEIKTKVGVIANYYPSIISESDFLKVQALTSKRQRKGGRLGAKIANLFSGIAFDLDSGSTMVCVRRNMAKPARFTPSHFETGHLGKSKSFPYDTFEQVFLAVTKDLSIDDIGASAPNVDDEISQIESEIADLDIRIAKVSSQVETGDVERIDEFSRILSSLTARHKSLSGRRESLMAEKHATSPSEALKESQLLVERLYRATGDDLVELRTQLRQQIRNLVKRIDCKIRKDGWKTAIYAVIMFHSGQQFHLMIQVRRGIPIFVMADSKKWDDKQPNRLAFRFDTSGRITHVGKEVNHE